MLTSLAPRPYESDLIGTDHSPANYYYNTLAGQRHDQAKFSAWGDAFFNRITSLSGVAGILGTSLGMSLAMHGINPVVRGAISRLGVRAPLPSLLLTTTAPSVITTGGMTLASGFTQDVPNSQNFFKQWGTSVVFALPSMMIGVGVMQRWGFGAKVLQDFALQPVQALASVGMTYGMEASGALPATEMSFGGLFTRELLEGLLYTGVGRGMGEAVERARNIAMVNPTPLTPPTIDRSEGFGITDKKRCRTGYFEYKLDDQGRIWTRYDPILAPAPFEVPVTEFPSATELKTRLQKVAGPYIYAYDETRRMITVTPKPDAAKRGFMLRGGRLVEVDRKLATQWQLHDGSGGPKLTRGVKIEGIQVSGEIIAARGSDGILYLYKPTVPDSKLSAKWSSSNGTPFGGTLRFPKARDWAFGLSIGVKPSERPTLEFMNPYTDINNYYEGADGGKVFYGFTATVGILTESSREIRYWDTGLPADFQRGFLTPHRGRVVGEKLAQSGSTWLLFGRDNGTPGLWIKGYDHEMLGSTPGLRFVFDPPKINKDRIYDLAEAQRYVPLPPWERIAFPVLEGEAIITDRMSIHVTGQGNLAREITIEGKDATGVTGYYKKRLSDKDWSFVSTGEVLVGGTITHMDQLIPTKPLTHNYPSGKWSGFPGASVAQVELNDFHPLSTLDEASTLRITLASGKKIDVLLRTTDGYSPLAHDARDDAAFNKGIGEEKVLTGTLEVPPDVESSPDPEIRTFVRKYLKPYHHIPNLFVIDADLDHVDIYTNGRYRKSDERFDYGHVPKLSISVKRDARGESAYELLANDPALKPNTGMPATRLEEIIAQNRAMKGRLRSDVWSRRWRHMSISARTFFISGVTKGAFFFMNLFGLTKRKHMGPISDIVPRFMSGHLHAHDFHTPKAYDRAVLVIEENIRQARMYKK